MQLSGFLGAATGATQYLQMVDQITAPGAITEVMHENQRRMLVQSWVHVLIIALVVIGNIIYFAGRKKTA